MHSLFLSSGGYVCSFLLGKDPECRARLYDDLKREVRAYDHMEHGVLDISLWDLVVKLKGVSVKMMLGGFRDRLPTYASSYCGQESEGGLSSIKAYADYSLECKEAGFSWI